MKYYWFNIKLGRDFRHGPGVYAQWVCLVMDENGKILWENCHPTETDNWGNPKIIWTEEPDGFSFDYKDEIVPYVKENPEKVKQCVLDSFEYEESIHLWKHYSIWCYECFDSEGDNFIAP